MTTTNLKEINQALKELDFGAVKMTVNNYQTKMYKDWNGKTHKGIRASSFGPMTCTNAHVTLAEEVLQNIVNKLEPLCHTLQSIDGGYQFVFDLGNKYRTIIFTQGIFPCYAREAGYDEGYKNIYWVPSIIDEKK